MVTFLCIVLFLLTFLMSVAILVQQPKQSGLSGSFGMGGDQMLGAGTPNALSKFTGFLAVGFLALCLIIGVVGETEANRSRIPMQEGDTQGGISPTIEGEPGTGETGSGDGLNGDTGGGTAGAGSVGAGDAGAAGSGSVGSGDDPAPAEPANPGDGG